MKKLAIISGIIISLFQPCYAFIQDMQTVGTSMTILQINIKPVNNYPKLLLVGIPIGASLETRLTNITEFINSICSKAYYISPSSISPFATSLYTDLWGKNSDVYSAGHQFYTEFDYNIEKLGETVSHTLNDGTIVDIIYMNIYGFLLYGDKHKIYPRGDISIGVNYMDYDSITDIWFLMTVVCYQECENKNIISPQND